GSSLGGDRGRVGAPWQVREPAEAVRGCIRADECWVAGGAEGHAFDVRDSFTTVGEAARERGYALRVVFAEVGRDRDLVAVAHASPGSDEGGEQGYAADRGDGHGEDGECPSGEEPCRQPDDGDEGDAAEDEREDVAGAFGVGDGGVRADVIVDRGRAGVPEPAEEQEGDQGEGQQDGERGG